MQPVRQGPQAIVLASSLVLAVPKQSQSTCEWTWYCWPLRSMLSPRLSMAPLGGAGVWGCGPQMGSKMPGGRSRTGPLATDMWASGKARWANLCPWSCHFLSDR